MADSSKITIQCPSCKTCFQSAGPYVEKRIKCPKCKSVKVFDWLVTDDEYATQMVKRVANATGGILKQATKIGIGYLKLKREDATRRKEFETMIEKYFSDDAVSIETFENLKTTTTSAGMSLSDAGQRIKAKVQAWMECRVSTSLTQNICDEDTYTLLNEICHAFNIPNHYSEQVRTQLDRQKLIESIVTGGVKPLPPCNISGLVVRSSEIVWWIAPCSLVVEKRNADEPQLFQGKLFITNIRIVFSSREHPEELSIDALNAIERDGDLVYLIGKSQRASTVLQVSDPELIAAYLTHVIRVFHRHNDIGYESEYSRRIPQDVKQAVWQRDGGRCVQCDANDYLEFDHVIPFSKGGANTIGNIQLLCRRCNSKKSNRL